MLSKHTFLIPNVGRARTSLKSISTSRSVYWCEQCGVPIADQKCGDCGSKGRRVCRDLVPVFSEEARLLSRISGEKQLANSRDFAFWTHGTRYYSQGREIARLSYEQTGAAVLQHPTGEDSSFPYEEPLATGFVNALIRANRSHIERMEHEAIGFIRGVVQEFPQHKKVVAFSGGKDSMVVSYLVRKAMGVPEVLHVFSDTTIESPGTYDFIRHFRSAHPRVPFVAALPHADFLEMCKVIGPPSRIKRWCCSTHKAYPLGAIYSVLAGSSGVLSFCGVRRAESSKRADHDRVHTNTKIADETMACPIIEWSDFDVWLFTLYRELPVNTDYRLGFRRIGCLFCPYNSKWSDYLMEVYYPAKAASWREFIDSYYGKHDPSDGGVLPGKRWRSRAGGIDRDGTGGKLEMLPCEDDSASFSVYLSGTWNESFWEYLKPFGRLNMLHDDGMVAQAMVLEPNMSVLFSVRVSRARNHIRFTVHKVSDQRILTQRISRQIKKHQACMLCGVCTTICPSGAIAVNGRYEISEASCHHCLRCVTKLPSGCVAWHSLAVTGKRGQG